MEGVESALLAGVEGLDLAAHLGVDGQHGVVPDPLSQMRQCFCCFANPFFSSVSSERLMEIVEPR